VHDQPTRRRYSAAYKVAILAEYDSLDRDGKGRLLQREGLYTSLLSQWRKQRDRGARSALDSRPGRPRVDPAEREIARLRARAERLEAELERARRVLEYQRTLLDELGTGNVPPDGG
jgi:transposase